jgi:VanZ family protein
LNIGAFFVLGWLMIRAELVSLRTPVFRVMLTFAAGLSLSTSAELFQQYLPGRIPAGLDIISNGIGVLAGAYFATFHAKRIAGWFLKETVATPQKKGVAQSNFPTRVDRH